MDFNCSYTLLSAYRKCHRRVKLQYVDKVLDYADVESRNFLCGIVVDWLFTKWVDERNFEPGWMLKKAESMFNWFASKKKVTYLNDKDKDGLIFKTCRSVEILEEKILAVEMDKKRFETQKKVIFEVEGVKFYMKLDIWFPDEHRLIDLKITKDKKYLDPVQLQMYTWGLRKSNLTVDSAGFYSPLMKEFEIEADVSFSAVEAFEQGMWRDIKLMQEENWECTAEDCWGCGVKAFCNFDPLDAARNVQRVEGSGFKFEL